MAYAALVSLNQATRLIYHEKYSISDGQREVITSIRQHTSFLISLFEQFPEKAKHLEANIWNLANEAELVIASYMMKRCRMSWFAFWQVRALGADNFEQKLRRVRDQICSTARDMMDDRRLRDLPAATSSSRLAATCENNVVMIGLDEDLLAIKGRLCGASSKLEVIPIVGMGGIGKTTLARNAYDDPSIIEYFDIRVFVQVSQDYSAKEFLSSLLASIELLLGEECDSGVAENGYNEYEIAYKVRRSLWTRRYLIVIDDIWSTNVWDDVRNAFPVQDEGSRIILTTRDSNVAAYASCGSPLHQMKLMDGNHSWNLLKHKVFRNCRDCPPELEGVGKAIARGCRGLPLAVVLVAGILSFGDKTRASWKEIAENVNSIVDGQLDKILSLSYMRLPHHLRPCFLFMAGYPEDHEIRVSRLIRLWVAEGFLKRKNGCKSLEEEAEEYLEDLVKRSLVLLAHRKRDGKIKSCRMHDLVRDMCLRKAQEEKFLLTDRYVVINARKHERRISFGHSHSQQNTLRFCSECCSPLSTILCFGTPGPAWVAFVVRISLLRVLDIMHCGNMKVPSQIFELIHLKYLALGPTFEIPEAISNLKNLQTLIIGPRAKFSEEAPSSSYLPQEIWSMPQLRHIIVYDSCKLPDPADGPTLENLQTLSFVRSFSCSKRILKMFPNLKKLGLVYFNHKVHHHLHILENLHQLEKLKIIAEGVFSWEGRMNPVFPISRKKLSLVGGRLPWKDMSIVGSLPNLQVLKLKEGACDGDLWETSDEEFTQLQYLQISGSNLEHWITESNHFPRLKSLWLHRCRNLTEIPVGIGTTLERIMVDALNQPLMDSAKEIQRVQHEEYGNDAFKVHGINRKRQSWE